MSKEAVIRVTCAGLLLASVAVTGARPLDQSDSDTFWHLALGRHMLEQRSFPVPEPFVFTATQKDVFHEWLSECLFAALERGAGLGGVRMLRALLLVAGIGVILWIGYRRWRSFPLAFTLAAATWIFWLPSTTARPHLLGWLAAAGTLALLPPDEVPLSWRRRSLLFGLLVLWANLHASVLLVPALAICQALGLAIKSLITRQPEWIAARRWAARAGVAGIACLLQPAGLHLLSYTWLTRHVNRYLSTEWYPLFHRGLGFSTVHLAWIALIIAVGICALLLLRRKETALFPNLAVVLGCLVLSLQTRRMVAFLFLALIYVGEAVRRLLPALRLRNVAHAWIVAVAVTVVGTSLPSSHAFSTSIHVEPGAFPAGAVTFLREARLTGRMFNPEGWGGYLIHELYPQYQVFADGRWFIVGRQQISDSVAIMARKQNADELLQQYRIDFLIEATRYYTQVPPPDPQHWVLAYADATAVVLLRRTATYAANRAAVCALAAHSPSVRVRMRWPVRLIDSRGGRSPTDVPSVLDECH